ncbi:ROK family protein [Romboutsia sp.]|uniref:ROK family protein n=1 Tax=Romboutsia sp. TaxID=1965302 RepID=UPI003F3E163A
MREFFAIDIGGTAIKYGIVNQLGEILYSNSTDTEATKGSQHIMNTVIDIINFLKEKNETVKHVGISSAGVIDNNEGKVVYAGYTMPGYSNTSIKEIIEKATNMIVEVENDVNCALLGEKWIGAGKELTDFMMLTVGTGIGGALCINNSIYSGKYFSAGEVGYMKVRGEDFQLKASTQGLINTVKKQLNIENLDGKQVFELAKNNKEVADRVEEFYEYLAEGINNIACVMNPEKIIVGGGITANAEFENMLNKAFMKYVDNIKIKKDLITTAKLGNNAGMVGAIYKFIQ